MDDQTKSTNLIKIKYYDKKQMKNFYKNGKQHKHNKG